VAGAEEAAAEATLSLARAVWRSWREGYDAPIDADALAALLGRALPRAVRLKTPEGYAFYALYPETYGEAAFAASPGPAKVIGLRSIGASLSAMAAAAIDASAPITLRPVGHPFARDLRLGAQLRRELTAGDDPVLIVDEGPGLSGSSFGAAADLFENQTRLLFLPSHVGELGAHASDAHRQRWRRARRAIRPFEDAVLPRLPGWVEDLTGPASAPLEDLSGGAWRDDLEGPRPPSWMGQERRKYRLRTDGGVFLLKFVGLGDIGMAKLERATVLADAGFCARPSGWRHGFLVEPFLEGQTLDPRFPDRGRLVDHLAAYIAFRARTFPAAPEDGAGLDVLAEMTRRNIDEAVDPTVAAGLQAKLERLHAAAPAPHPVRSDNRMHAWEWLQLRDGRLVKTDALDHDDAHDLIGCQDPAWDVAGAEADFALTPEETAGLLERMARAGAPVSPALLDFLRLAYAGFQLGYWTFAAADGDAPAEAERGSWADRLAVLA
jgi:hypothetical protein